jgi:hypothetical protein
MIVFMERKKWLQKARFSHRRVGSVKAVRVNGLSFYEFSSALVCPEPVILVFFKV